MTDRTKFVGSAQSVRIVHHSALSDQKYFQSNKHEIMQQGILARSTTEVTQPSYRSAAGQSKLCREFFCIA